MSVETHTPTGGSSDGGGWLGSFMDSIGDAVSDFGGGGESSCGGGGCSSCGGGCGGE